MSLCSLNVKGKEKYQNVVQEVYTYFNKHIVKNKQKRDAIYNYKHLDYSQINGLLYKNLTLPVFDLLDTLYNIAKKQKDENETNPLTIARILHEMNFLENLNRHVKTIKILDGIIAKAPKMKMTTDVVLYRGMNSDILNNLVCETDRNGKNSTYYYTTPSYMSTSLSPSVSFNFTDPTKCGTFLTIITTAESLKELQGIFVNWNIGGDGKFENANIDSEYEFILPRLTKFKVEKVDYIPYPENPSAYTYRDIPCKKRAEPLKVKHYTLSVVSQPLLKDLSKTYKTLFKNVNIDIIATDLKDLYLENYLNDMKDFKENDKK